MPSSTPNILTLKHLLDCLQTVTILVASLRIIALTTGSSQSQFLVIRRFSNTFLQLLNRSLGLLKTSGCSQLCDFAIPATFSCRAILQASTTSSSPDWSSSQFTSLLLRLKLSLYDLRLYERFVLPPISVDRFTGVEVLTFEFLLFIFIIRRNLL